MTGFYSIVQFVPDAARKEGANVGVLIFVPSVPQVALKMSEDNEWPLRMFGNLIDEFHLTGSNRAFANIVRVEEGPKWMRLDDLRHFRATLANSIQITEPCWIAVEDLAKDLEDLFQDVVAPPVPREPR